MLPSLLLAMACTGSGTIDPGGDDSPSTTDSTYQTGMTDTSDGDRDGDGSPDSEDCDPDNADVYPGAPETCADDTDRNCDGFTPDACTGCLEVLETGAGTEDGIYRVDPDGPDGALGTFETWCDQTTIGGGWNLVQRTLWDPEQTAPLTTGYDGWLLDTMGSPDPDEVFRLQGQAWDELMAEGSMLVVHHARRTTDDASCEPVYYAEYGATLQVTDGNARMTPAAGLSPLVTGEFLSTTDSGPQASCVNDQGAAPWFYSACCLTCPTFGGSYWEDGAHPMASYLEDTPDLFGQTVVDTCGDSPALRSLGYFGVNVMEIYVR